MPGIFDPFAPPAPPKKPKPTYEQAMAEKERLLERDAAERGSIELDGGSHVLKFDAITFPEVPGRLGALILSIQNDSPALKAELRRTGVFISNQAILDVDAHRLETPSGIIHVCDVPPGKGETKVYQRLAYSLSLLPIKKHLVAHKASLITRG